MLYHMRGLRNRRRLELRWDIQAALNMEAAKESNMQLALAGFEYDEKFLGHLIEQISRK